MGIWDTIKGFTRSPSKLYVFENGVLYAFNPKEDYLKRGRNAEDLARDIVRDGYGLSEDIRVESVGYKEMPRAARKKLESCVGVVDHIRHIHREDISRFRDSLQKQFQIKLGKRIKVE